MSSKTGGVKKSPSIFSGRAEEVKLNYCTNETISKVTFNSRCSNSLLASSWDGFVTLFDVKNNEVRRRYNHGSPVLDCSFFDDAHCFSGGLDRAVKCYDMVGCKEVFIGRHEDAIKSVEFSPEFKTLITGGWDSKVKLWDMRCHSCIMTLPQPGKVYTLATCGDKFIVGTSGKKVYVWDLKNLGYVLQRRDSSLRYQTRCIKSFPNHIGYALSSIEGRVALEFLDPNSEIQKKKYAFKCHRIHEGQIEKIYPVNAITFLQNDLIFATGGSDGYVNIWDVENKKRLREFRRFPLPVTSAAFDNSGTRLAIAYSQLFNEFQVDVKGGIAIKYFKANTP